MPPSPPQLQYGGDMPLRRFPFRRFPLRRFPLRRILILTLSLSPKPNPIPDPNPNPLNGWMGNGEMGNGEVGRHGYGNMWWDRHCRRGWCRVEWCIEGWIHTLDGIMKYGPLLTTHAEHEHSMCQWRWHWGRQEALYWANNKSYAASTCIISWLPLWWPTSSQKVPSTYTWVNHFSKKGLIFMG